VGAEGLDVTDGQTIALADRPADFANWCLNLADDAEAARAMSMRARDVIASRYSWDQVSRRFEQLLMRAPEPATK